MPTKLVRTDSASTFSTFNSAAFADAASHVSNNSSVNSGGSFIPPPADQQDESGENGQDVEGAGADIEDNELTPQATITETDGQTKDDNLKPEADTTQDVSSEVLATKPLDSKPLNAKSEQSKQEAKDQAKEAEPNEGKSVEATSVEPKDAEVKADIVETDVAKTNVAKANEASKDSKPSVEPKKLEEEKEPAGKVAAEETETKLTQPEPREDPETALVDKQNTDQMLEKSEGYHREHSECYEYLFGHCFIDYLDQGDCSLSCCWSSLLGSMCGIFFTNKKR